MQLIKILIMRVLSIILFLGYFSLTSNAQIIADHTVVDLYDDIPEQWMDSVKTMLVDIAGESHSEGYRDGMELLEEEDAAYQVTTYTSARPAYSTEYVRLGAHGWIGEAKFFTSTSAITAYKTLITDQNETSNPYDVMGFGWCYDMDRGGSGGTVDPVYDVRWSGSTEGGPDGDMEWGLDAGDVSLTGNSVTMDTYLDAVKQYQHLCTDSGYSTTIVFTTGPVDMYGGTEEGFQREIKHDYIRDYVAADETRILFDYADILCWNNDGEYYTSTWDDGGEDREHANIHPDNLEGGYTAHIGNVGALRLGKAMWWMLARIAGWDGNIPVSQIQLSAENDLTELITGGELQFTASILPENASNQEVDWSIINGTGTASISSQGLLHGGLPGSVAVVALAQDGSWVGDTLDLTVTEPLVPVTNITITTEGDFFEIDNETFLQCVSSILPVDASNPAVVWSVISGSGSASVSSSGLLSVLSEGTVEVVATAEDGSGVSDTIQLTMLSSVLVTDIETSSSGGVTQLLVGEELQMSASVLPEDATNPAVVWSVIDRTGSASVSSAGLVSALGEGIVDLVATAADGSGTSDIFPLTIYSATVLVSGLSVVSAGDVTELISGADLQFSVIVEPETASDKEVAWSVVNGSGTATITNDGLLSAGNPGSVLVVAAAKDGSGVSDSYQLIILPPLISVTGITIESAGGISMLESGQALQFSAIVLPETASNKELDWSISNGSGSASISKQGLLSAGNPGTVTVVAAAIDGSGISDNFLITITAPAVSVSSIVVSSAGNIAELESGSTLQFSASVLPETASNKEVVWSASNGTGTASISEQGLLTAGSPGTVWVVATAMDGSGVTGSFELSIPTPGIAVSSITISSSGNVSQLEEGEVLQLTATVIPSDADNPSVFWHVTRTTNMTGLGTITEDGMFIALAKGDVNVVAVAQDGSGANDIFTLTILSGPSAINDSESGEVIFYPNPGKDLFYLNAGDLEIELIQVVDARGSVVLALTPEPGKQIIELDLASQLPGLYFIKAFSGDQLIVRKAVITR